MKEQNHKIPHKTVHLYATNRSPRYRLKTRIETAGLMDIDFRKYEDRVGPDLVRMILISRRNRAVSRVLKGDALCCLEKRNSELEDYTSRRPAFGFCRRGVSDPGKNRSRDYLALALAVRSGSFRAVLVRTFL